MLIVLLGAAVLTVVIGDLSDAAVIMAVVAANTTVGVVQEIRADRAITALNHLSAPRARVFRDGAEVEIPAAEVVPGDLLVLAEGDLVAADGEVVAADLVLAGRSPWRGPAPRRRWGSARARDGGRPPPPGWRATSTQTSADS